MHLGEKLLRGLCAGNTVWILRFMFVVAGIGASYLGSRPLRAKPSQSKCARRIENRPSLFPLVIALAWFVTALLNVWAAVALYIDLRSSALRLPATLLYAFAIVAIFVKLNRRAFATALYIASFCLVLSWWIGLKPSNEGAWRPDTNRVAWAEIGGNSITIHNLRNCDYHTEIDLDNCWSDKTVDLFQLRAVDLFVVNWGLGPVNHIIVSFQFGDKEHIAFSVEPRWKVGQSYSGIASFFRQYELIFIAGDERDLIGLRTNFRQKEQVYLYRTQIRRQEATQIFLIYLEYLNRLQHRPEWYNPLTKNCTTTMSKAMIGDLKHGLPWPPRLLASTSFDRLLYNRNRLVSDHLSFPELKNRENINAAATAANRSTDFSYLIRVGRVGF
jgi:Domain of unknown function (DUF4105)